jgi:hypothetical protein
MQRVSAPLFLRNEQEKIMPECLEIAPEQIEREALEAASKMTKDELSAAIDAALTEVLNRNEEPLKIRAAKLADVWCRRYIVAAG